MRGRNARKNSWLAIESKYGKPVKLVILELRERYSWFYIAVELGVSDWTLRQWRRALGIEINQARRKRDTISTP